MGIIINRLGPLGPVASVRVAATPGEGAAKP